MNEIEKKSSGEKSKKQRVGLKKKIHKSNKRPARPTMKKREMTKITNIWLKWGIVTDPADTKRRIRKCYKQPHIHKVDNLDEIDHFHSKSTNYYNLSNMKKDNLNSPVII